MAFWVAGFHRVSRSTYSSAVSPRVQRPPSSRKRLRGFLDLLGRGFGSAGRGGDLVDAEADAVDCTGGLLHVHRDIARDRVLFLGGAGDRGRDLAELFDGLADGAD